MTPHHTHKFSGHYCVECGCFDGGRGETWEPCPGAVRGMTTVNGNLIGHHTHRWPFAGQLCETCGCKAGSPTSKMECTPTVAAGLHGSHDWSGFSWTCTECGCTATSFDARMQCRPPTDDSPAEPAPREIDWSKITGSFA